jgi:hypothetical protein
VGQKQVYSILYTVYLLLVHLVYKNVLTTKICILILRRTFIYNIFTNMFRPEIRPSSRWCLWYKNTIAILIKNDQQDGTVWDNLFFHCPLAALLVSSDIFPHHQEHLNCNYSFWFHSHRQKLQLQLICSWWWAKISLETCTAAKEQWNNKLSYTVASCWSF